MPLSNWSVVAADNDDSDLASGINLAEGQAPGSLNDSIRSIMAVLAAANASDTAKGFVELATAAETLAGTDATRALTPAGFANKSLSSTGYYKFPGGFIVQWGVLSGASPVDVTFPTTFPTAGVFAAAFLDGVVANSQALSCHTESLTASGVRFHKRFAEVTGTPASGLAVQAGRWFALGY